MHIFEGTQAATTSCKVSDSHGCLARLERILFSELFAAYEEGGLALRLPKANIGNVGFP